jgi:hypothetical protein
MARSNELLSDEEFLARFESHSLTEFSHRDHLRVAYAYARRDGVQGAVEGARRIRGFAAALGDSRKYHDTMTVGWARVVGSLAVDSPCPTFDAFVDAQSELLLRRDLLSDYYTGERLFSEEARAGFVEPDLAPLP